MRGISLSSPPGSGGQLARTTLRVILVLDGYMGAAWTFGAPNRTDVPVFQPARQFIGHHVGLEPSRIWGLALLIVAAATLTAMEWRSELFVRMLIVPVCGFWVFWLIIDIYSAFQPRASLTAWATVAIVLIGHIRPVLTSHRMARRADPGG